MYRRTPEIRGFFRLQQKKKKRFGNRFDVFVVLKTVCYSGICEVCLNLCSLEQSWFCASSAGVVPPEVKPPGLASLVEKTLRHGQRASSWKPRLKEKKKVMPYFCQLSNIQAEGKKCSAEKSHPRTPPPRGVFPWPLWQHITLPYRRLPTPQLFRETNKRAFKLFASLFFRA